MWLVDNWIRWRGNVRVNIRRDRKKGPGNAPETGRKRQRQRNLCETFWKVAKKKRARDRAHMFDKHSNQTRSHSGVLKKRQGDYNKGSREEKRWFPFSFQTAIPDIVVLARCEPAVIQASDEESSDEQDHDSAPKRKAVTNHQGRKSMAAIISDDEAEDEANEGDEKEDSDDSSEFEGLDVKALKDKILREVFFSLAIFSTISFSDLVVYY